MVNMTETAKIAIDRFDQAVTEGNHEDAWNAVVLVIHDVIDCVEVALLEHADFGVVGDVMIDVNKYLNKIYL